MIDYRFGDDFLFLLVPASPKIGPFENHHNEWNPDANNKTRVAIQQEFFRESVMGLKSSIK